MTLKSAANGIAKPVGHAAKVVATKATQNASWRVSCSATPGKCFTELGVYAVLVVVAYRLLLRLRNFLLRQGMGYHTVAVKQRDARSPVIGSVADDTIEMMENGTMAAVDEDTGRPMEIGRSGSSGCIDVDDYAPRLVVTHAAPAAAAATGRTLRGHRRTLTPVRKELGSVLAELHADAEAARAIPGHDSSLTLLAADSAAVPLPPPPLLPTAPLQSVQPPPPPPAPLQSAPPPPPPPSQPPPAEVVPPPREAPPREAPPTEAHDSGPHSILHAATQAWRASIVVATGDAGGGDAGGGDELDVERLVAAFRTSLATTEVFGSMMTPAVKNDVANLEKLTKAWAELGQRHGKPQVATLRGLLEAERRSGIHKPGGVLRDPSAAIALTWLRRSLNFQRGLLEGLRSDRTAALSAVGAAAYKAHLECYHNWMLKGTFKVGLSGLPAREAFFEKLCPELARGQREVVCYREVAEVVAIQRRIDETLGALLVALDLDDQRKA